MFIRRWDEGDDRNVGSVGGNGRDGIVGLYVVSGRVEWKLLGSCNVDGNWRSLHSCSDETSSFASRNASLVLHSQFVGSMATKDETKKSVSSSFTDLS